MPLENVIAAVMVRVLLTRGLAAFVDPGGVVRAGLAVAVVLATSGKLVVQRLRREEVAEVGQGHRAETAHPRSGCAVDCY
jgi:hypothetical protein